MAVIQLRDKMAKEQTEYENGMEMPDLMNEANVRLLRAWQGDSNSLGLFRFIRVCGNDQQFCKVVQNGSHKSLTESDGQTKGMSAVEGNMDIPVA